MTQDERKVIELALDLATMHHTDAGYDEFRLKVRQLGKEALAQPEQKPVATDWSAVHEKLELVWYRELSADEGLDEVQDLINTTPPQRKPLTDEEILTVARDHYNPHQRPEISFARAIEAAHGIKE